MNSNNKEYLIQELKDTLANRSITPNKCDTVTKVLPIILEIFTRERITDRSHKSLELITYNTLCYMLDKYILEISNCTDDNIITAVEAAVNKTEEVINIIKNTEKEIPEKEKVKFFNLINNNHLFLFQGVLLRQIIQSDIRKALKPELTRKLKPVDKSTAIKKLFSKTRSGQTKLQRLIELLTENNGKFTEYIGNVEKVLKHNTQCAISNEDIEILNLFLYVDMSALYNSICVIRNAYIFKNFNGKSNQKFLSFFDNLFFFWSNPMTEGKEEEITRYNPNFLYDIINNTTGTIYIKEISKQIANDCLSTGVSQDKFNNTINTYKNSIITLLNTQSPVSNKLSTQSVVSNAQEPLNTEQSVVSNAQEPLNTEQSPGSNKLSTQSVVSTSKGALNRIKRGVSFITRAQDKIEDKIIGLTVTAVKTATQAKALLKEAKKAKAQPVQPVVQSVEAVQVQPVVQAVVEEEEIEVAEEAIDPVAEAADTVAEALTPNILIEAQAEAVKPVQVQPVKPVQAEAVQAVQAEAVQPVQAEAVQPVYSEAYSAAYSVDQAYVSIKNKLRNIILCVISIIIIIIISVLCVIYSGGISRYITQCIKYFSNIIYKVGNKINNTVGIKSSLEKIIEDIGGGVSNLFN
ncbi:hypothetical protein NEPAR06_0446 [Nematocida parisii]|uniref:Uncharacterized protein n=1 Tax=Nematocida parisii (strain ERTm3) TaxID=935791 RepID=I3EIB9_NEMP3|nr:uncharacterized protein NEPG_01821 [Nematocida parisii ERTm1]EIJ88966.1 hypothetical protein NEQG_00785 [Nematocida parisii ERTm3]KAI5146358.1 hypothetical protein NEPAR07_2320 [Nematocida parisii]EIJ93479.1 hypothetical protein NEPG_01821 [Nematocida parisii ERTm1]KAI5153438.1 hypothetical protein NEPAR06_0446 [Nematocida parisii]KAI5156226.1 hypothetical protein NEPAR05_0403 [Nematocida parisii]|eukprot:XP_013059649.1 hypothetical protein NEPG_01821 [Nematocida parisii ERTm1]